MDTILELHDLARTDALEQAVASGLITQEQADWLLSRMDCGQSGSGTGLCRDDCTQTYTRTVHKNQNGHSKGRQDLWQQSPHSNFDTVAQKIQRPLEARGAV